MGDTTDIMELYMELYRMEEKIELLSGRLSEMEQRLKTETELFHKELDAQKAYYSGHIKELYQRTQLAVK